MFKILFQELSPFYERFLNQRLSIEVEEIKHEHTDLNFDLTLNTILQTNTNQLHFIKFSNVLVWLNSFDSIVIYQ